MKIVKYIKSRWKAVGYTLEGIWRLVYKEESIQAQIFLFILAIVMGWYFDISRTEWIFQIFVFAMIFITEGLNTAIEEVCNFIHPEWHGKIKEIKDIGAGAVLISALFGAVIMGIIYIPKMVDLF